MTLPEIPKFASLFQFDQRVSTLETKVSEFNQTSQFAKVFSSIPGIVDNYLASKIKEEVDVAVRLQSNRLREKAQAENQEFLNQVDSTMKAIIKEQNLYNALVELYNSDKDIMSSYGDVVTLKRGRDDQDKDKDPSAGSERGTKRRKSCKDAEPLKGSKSKESRMSGSSKGTKPQPKSSTLRNDWFKKPEKPLNVDLPWDKGKAIDSRPPQTWINNIAKARQPPSTFDELLSTHIDFSAYVMNNLKIDNPTQEILVGPAFNLLKGTCKSFAELEYHFEE
ncbi:hypothetical protein Tco_1339491 [Tanacetum coccineum]